MKKLFTALICATMILGIGGCGSSNDKKTIKLEDSLKEAGFTITETEDGFKISDNRNTEENKFDIDIMTYIPDKPHISASILVDITTNEDDYEIVGALYYIEDGKATSTTYSGEGHECEYYYDGEVNSGCTENELNQVKNVKKRYDSLLEKLDITQEEFNEAIISHINSNK